MSRNALLSPDVQYAEIVAAMPRFAFHSNQGWARVLTRLGRAPRPEIEHLLRQIPLDDMFAPHSIKFIAWVRDRLDDIYPTDA